MAGGQGLFDGALDFAQRPVGEAPVDFAALHIGEHHLLLATATACVGPPALRQAFRKLGGWRDDLATLHRRLRDAERADFAERRGRWPEMA